MTGDVNAAKLCGAKISYLFLMVKNVQAMLSFYQGQLGFEVVYRDQSCAFLQLPHSPWPKLALLPASEQATQAQNNCFIVIDVDSVDSARDALSSRNLAVSTIEPVPYGRAFQLKDPEGNTIEIHEPERQHTPS